MYIANYLEEEAILVSLFWGREHTEADYLKFWEMGHLLDRDGQRRTDGTTIQIILVTDNAPRPNSVWRKRFAEAQVKLRTPLRLNVIVTNSAIIRGVLTVINWISPAPENHEVQIFSHTEDAAQWLETRTKRPMLLLRAGVERALRLTDVAFASVR